MPRLFTGLELPPEVTQQLASLRGGLSGARWIDEENYHITLRFIGDIDHATARDVYLDLWRIKRPPLKISLTELSFFGGDRPHSLIVKVQPTPELIELQMDHERIMRRIGLPAETRKFTPHVTLARLKGVSAIAVADYLSLRSFPLQQSFTADAFLVYSSRDSVGGGPYLIEAEYPLGHVQHAATG
jgi:RNA 2',3'-cyclic 3'-phosphodiesterase